MSFARTLARCRGPIAAALLVPACVDLEVEDDPALGSAAQPLIGGTVPIEDLDLAAVALTTPSNSPFCTGTLVSPRVVLTAAHCIDQLSGNPAVIAFFGTDVRGDEGVRIGVQRARTHPGWTGSLQDNHDIGVLLLNFPAPDGVDPIPLFTGNLEDHLGEPIRRIGFGIHDGETRELDGKKRIGTTTLNYISTSQDWFFAGHPELRTCQGDSGGPALLDIDGVEQVAGVHSFGFSGCASPDNGDTRVDFYAEDFVIPWIQENDPTCGLDWYCARIGCIDDPDCLPCGPDGTCTEGCALPDPDCPTSALGEICQADSQCMSGLCVYWQSDPGMKFCSRPCGAGGDCPAGMSCQSVQPFGDICYYDDDPPGVVGSRCAQATDCGSYLCEDGVCVTRCNLALGLNCLPGFECATRDGESYFCFALDEGTSGGCCSTAGGSSPASALLLAGLIALAWRRRRSR